MTTPSFNTMLVRDSRLNDISDTLTVPVFQGASQNSYQRINAETEGTSSIQFNINPPSESIVIDRKVLIQSTLTFKLVISCLTDTGGTATKILNMGVDSAFQSFPLNKLFNTISAQINNTNISLNQKEIIDLLLLTYDAESLNEYEGMSPYLRDQKYYSILNGASYSNSSITGELNADLNGVSPRGSFKIIKHEVTKTIAGAQASTTYLTSPNTADQVFTILLTAEFTEPLFLSPFITCSKSTKNNQGFLGINNMSFVFNLDPSASRCFSIVPDANKSFAFSLEKVENSKMYVNYLSTNALDKIKANNSIPYYDFPRYLTTLSESIAQPVSGQNAGTAGSSTKIGLNSSNIQLNQIPELIMIAVRKRISTQTVTDAASFLTIDGISINFNNASGLLSNASRFDLYNISKANGSKQSWAEWSDYISVNTSYVAGMTASQLYNRVAPLGNVLFINPSKDLSLPPFLSNGSIGQFNLQYTLSVMNNTGSAISANSLEIVTIVMNGGMFSTFSGSSSTYVGLLNKQLVLQTGSESEAVSSSNVEEMIGGNIANRVSSAIGGLLPRLGFRNMNKPMPNARSMNMPSSSNSKLDRFA